MHWISRRVRTEMKTNNWPPRIGTNCGFRRWGDRMVIDHRGRPMPLSRSIKALTTYIRENCANGDAIEPLCGEIEELAERADTRFFDFQALWRKILGAGLNIPVGYKEAIASAFLCAGRLDPPYRETDAAEGDGTRNFISAQHDKPTRAVAFNTAEGWSRDVPEDIAYEVLDQAHDADETLTDGTKIFIDRHVTPGEKRPPVPSIGRGVDQAVRRKA